MSENMESVKCIKCEIEIKRIDLEDDVVPKKGEYINDLIAGCGCVDKGIAPGILVEMINPSFVSASSEEEGTFHGYMCDWCLQDLTDKKIIENGPEEDKEGMIYGREEYENSDMVGKEKEKEELEQLRKEIMAKFEGKDVSLNQLFLDYGSNKLIGVSIGDDWLDCREWKNLLKEFKDVGSSDIVLVKVSDAGFTDVVSLRTYTIRIMINDPTVELMMRLMEKVVNLGPDSVDCQNGYIDAFFD